MDERIQQILGIGSYKPIQDKVCFLPFLGEFGWYLMTYCKRVQGYNHPNKIVCIKKGHECLFPSASHFVYDWEDIEDDQKAGIHQEDLNPVLKNKITEKFGDSVFFLSCTDTSWEEKTSLAKYTFLPRAVNNFGLNVDIVITPRKRNIDPQRNWKQENWQLVIDQLVSSGYTVGICGTKETSYQLRDVKYKSYNYMDVDSDVEMINKAQLVITQESGLSYLSYLCKNQLLSLTIIIRILAPIYIEMKEFISKRRNMSGNSRVNWLN